MVQCPRNHFAYDNNIRPVGIADLGPADNSTKTESMQMAANRATADYSRYNLRSGAVREIDVLQRSECPRTMIKCHLGEQAGSDNDNCVICDSEQVTRGRLNACCSRYVTSYDRKSYSTGKEVMNNYDVRTASRLGRCKIWRNGTGN
jgi:hypothetical protein